MSFTAPIRISLRYGLEIARVEVPLHVLGSFGERVRAFQFDTGCGLTTLSEDVAAALGLPSGGRPVNVFGALGSGVGRLVPATFRFSPDTLSGVPSDLIDSEWVVVAGRTKLALLGFQEVHRHFTIGTDDDTTYFMSR